MMVRKVMGGAALLCGIGLVLVSGAGVLGQLSVLPAMGAALLVPAGLNGLGRLR